MPDVVLLPNHSGVGDDAEERFREFLHWSRRGHVEGWTCKKTASEEDLYFFWFSEPVSQVAGLGVCNGVVEEQENDGTWDWTASPKGWFCGYRPLIRFRHPVSKKDIVSDAVLAKWWLGGKPWKGRPKTMPPTAAHRLLKMVVSVNEQDRRLVSVLANYDARLEFNETSSAIAELPDDDADPPPVIRLTSTRRVRNTLKGQQLKNQYRGKCQVCGVCILTPKGVYAEIHHMRPLGRDHGGLDNWNNMLVLCPNCHVQFDSLAVAIDPDDRRIVSFSAKQTLKGRKLGFRRGHALERENVLYLWKRFCVANQT
jgi:hypothetical protein